MCSLLRYIDYDDHLLTPTSHPRIACRIHSSLHSCARAAAAEFSTSKSHPAPNPAFPLAPSSRQFQPQPNLRCPAEFSTSGGLILRPTQPFLSRHPVVICNLRCPAEFSISGGLILRPTQPFLSRHPVVIRIPLPNPTKTPTKPPMPHPMLPHRPDVFDRGKARG